MATLARPRTGWFKGKSNQPKAEPKIIHQAYFKSVGPRTYAVQVKEIANGNHLLVLTEGKRDDATDEVRKTRIFVYAEDFAELFKMLDNTRQFIDAHPVSAAVKAKRDRHWARNKQAPAAKATASLPSAPVDMSDDETEMDR